MKIKPVGEWENMGTLNGRLRFRRALLGRFYVHASIATRGDRATLRYNAVLKMPAGTTPCRSDGFRTLVQVMAWALPKAQAKCDAILGDVPAAPKRRGMVKP